MANEVSKIKLPNDTTEYPLQDDQAIASITRSGTTFTATRRDGTSFTFTQQDNNTTYTFATGDNNGQIKVTPSGGTAQNVSVKGLGAAAYKGTTTSVTSGSSDLVTSGAVYTAIDNLPSPMVFKGTLGTNGTITTLPTASSANEGFVYKCITAGTYASQEAKVGDVFVSNTTEWVLIPAGDTDTDTWRNIKVNGTQKLGNGISTGAVDFISGNHVSLSFNATGNKLTVAHSDTSSQASVTNSGRTYIQSIGLDGDGHVTSLTSATETVVNTDRYVNSAAFANDTSGVKMTLTRAGSDTATVTGIIPKVSSSTAGVAPKGATVSSQSQSTKFLREDGSWATPSYTTNTNTTYTIGTSGNNITLTPSSGSVQSITAPYATDAGYLRDSVTATAKLRYINSNDATTWTADTLAATDSIAVIRNSVTGAWATGHIVTFNVNTVGTPFQLGVHDSSELYFYKRYKSGGVYGDWVKMNAGYADSAGSATKATQDGSGNTITSTYVKKAGDTMTGALTLYHEGTTNDNHPTELKFQNKDTTTGKTSYGAIRVYDGGESGSNLVIIPNGNMFIGSGEAAQHHYDLYTHSTAENFFATADTSMYLQANGQTIANRVGMGIYNDHSIRPIKADASTDNVGSIGTSSFRWANGYFTNINGVAVGDSPKFTDTNTTYTLGTSGNNVTLTPSSGSAQSITVPYATTATSATTSQYLTVPRVAKDSQSLPGANKCIVEEYSGGTNYNLPSNAYYHIYSSQGPDTHYGCQLALGMTIEAAYYRVYNNQSWGNWKSIINTNTDVNVKVNNTNPTTGTWYYPVWYTGTSGTGNVNANDGLRYYCLQGTASAAGRSIMQVGNGTQTGTAGNKYGEFRIYSQKQGYSTLTMASGATAERKHSLPDVTGTIGVFTATPTSGQVVVSDGTAGGFKTTGYTIAKSVPSNAVFTDTNTKVTTANDTSTNSNFRLLMAATADDTNREDTAKKNECLWFNPSTQTLRVGDDATGDHIINIGGSTVLNGNWAESDGTLSIYGKYYEAIHIYQTSSSGANSYIQFHHNLNMGAHNISNGTISNMTYTEGVTHTTGYLMHGRDTSQQYSCQWASSKLNFYVGTTNIGNISDKQLKSEIDDVDPRLMEAIAECKIYQYKAFNRDGLISVGIMAQDLVEKCEEKGVRPENYELLTKMNFIQDDDTLYYSVDYNQYATFMINYLQKKVKELEEKIK